MASVRLVVLFQNMTESFKSLLASQPFGPDYELLRTELSVQLLRINLWAESVGLSFQGGPPSRFPNTLPDQENFNRTTIQVIESISFLLLRLEKLRDNYIPKTRLPSDGHWRGRLRLLHHSSSVTTLSPINTNETSRLHTSTNQKHASILAIARWTIRDEGRFERNVKRVKELVTGLEDMARASGLSPGSPVQVICPSSPGPDDIPPPYSLAFNRSIHQGPGVRPLIPRDSSDTLNCSPPLIDASPVMFQCLFVMEAYLNSCLTSEDYPGPRAPDKLVELSERQFIELLVDVYDELLRRQEYELPNHEYLPERRSFHPYRNHARKTLSTLVPLRFGHLLEDIVFELKRRSPNLQRGSTNPVVDSPVCQNTPQPLLPLPEPHHSALIDGAATDPGQPSHRNSQSTTNQNQELPIIPTELDGGAGVVTKLSTKIDDPCSTILPAILRKYHITASWMDYSLYIVYGDKEHRLELDEKPLQIFKLLAKEGSKPRFMLRKISYAGELEA